MPSQGNESRAIQNKPNRKDRTMNDTNDTTQATAVFDAPKGDYGPELAFYHANAKNTGVAIRFRVEPAASDRDGAVFFSIARQKTVGNLAAQGPDRFASFDNRVRHDNGGQKN